MNKQIQAEPKRPLRLDLQGAFIRRTDLSDANLEGANLTEADLSGAVLRGANMRNAKLVGTVLKGADLRGVKNLTIEQLSAAIVDEHTLLPDYIARAQLKPKRRRSGAMQRS
jgi:uncharacterized protein YjbI with pentapeptide repeats